MAVCHLEFILEEIMEGRRPVPDPGLAAGYDRFGGRMHQRRTVYPFMCDDLRAAHPHPGLPDGQFPRGRAGGHLRRS